MPFFDSPPRPRSPGRTRRGASLLEMIAAVALLGAVATVAIPRLGDAGSSVDAASCDRHREAIDLQAALYRRNTGSWPQANLSDLAATLPEGLPTCPVDGTAYTFNPTSGETVPHVH